MSIFRKAARSLLAVCVVAIGVAAAQPAALVQVQPTTGASFFTSIAQWPISTDLR